MKLQTLALILFYLSTPIVWANAQLYNFETYSVNEGLPQSQVNTIYEDSRGYLWFGTAGGGVCQFDGINFTQFDEKQGLCGPIVTAVVEDNSGNLWIGATWGGISRFNGKKFQNYTRKNGLISTSTTAILKDRNGNIFVGSNTGITIIDNNHEFSHLSKLQGMSSGNVTCLSEAEDGGIWIGTDAGINIYKDGQVSTLGSADGLPYDKVTCIAQDTLGNMWIGFERKGVVILTAISMQSGEYDFEQFGVAEGIDKITVTTILQDSRGLIWIGTNGRGIFKYRNGKLTNYRYKNGLASEVVLSIVEDRTGNIWFGTNGAGVIKLSEEMFTYYYNVPGLNDRDIFAICEDVDKNIWVGTSTNGVYRYTAKSGGNHEIKHFSTDNGLSGSNVRAIIKDRKDNLWFATENGACKFDGSTFSTLSTKNGLTNNPVKSLMEDKEGNIWLGTYGNGAIKYDGETFTNYTTEDGLSHDYIHSMLADSKGNLWFGTGAGVNMYDGKTFTSYGLDEEFCNTYIGSIAEDHAGNIYFGTDRCIMRYNGRKFESLTDEDGLLSNTVYLLISDEDGNIWAGTNKGVDKLFIDKEGQIEWVKNYDKEQGFTGIECNSRAVCKDSRGRLWFGTVKGVIEYNPEEDFGNFVEPITSITGIKLFLEDRDLLKYSQGSYFWHKLPKELYLPHNQNHLTFHFIGIDLKTPEKIQYQYILDGFDEDWSPSTFKNEATYSNIPPGEYVFKVKAVNNDGIWTEHETSFAFEVGLPYWREWWFYLITLSALALGIYAVVHYRTKKLLELRLKLEELVAIRTEEITKQKDDKEILVKEIHHRVKNNLQVINSLLSIQSSYITDEDALSIFRKTQDRIKSMSLIHEKMYQSNDLAHINITEYLNLLAANLISSYTIDKHISLDIQASVKKLSIDTLIPMGLIVNELMTNSIKYAFKGKKAGKISVFLGTTEDRRYKLIISDNGSGMKTGVPDGKSETMGMELIKTLVEKINGTIELRSQKGTSFLILFLGHQKDRII